LESFDALVKELVLDEMLVLLCWSLSLEVLVVVECWLFVPNGLRVAVFGMFDKGDAVDPDEDDGDALVLPILAIV
jgi:hypothetical protein